jgi:L-aminopeptidase/D-esterase-like protein
VYIHRGLFLFWGFPGLLCPRAIIDIPGLFGGVAMLRMGLSKIETGVSVILLRIALGQV